MAGCLRGIIRTSSNQGVCGPEREGRVRHGAIPSTRRNGGQQCRALAPVARHE